MSKEFAGRIIKGSKADRKAAQKGKEEKYARVKAEQEAERKRIAEMLANMTEKERKAFWAEKKKSAVSGPESYYH